MTKINPISTEQKTFKYFLPKPNNVSINNSKTNTLIKNSLICLGILGSATVIIANRRNFAFSSAKKLLGKELCNSFWVQMKEFPEDIKYRKKLLKVLNLPNSDLPVLRSIIGNCEYKKIITEFSNSPIHYTPGQNIINKAQDNYELNGIINKTFRISLHNHSNHSDGVSSIQDFLNQATKYADEIANYSKNNPNIKLKNAPFTIAITDHDTLEGCKEAVKIISQNPKKYKNLRLVLGTELTVENKMLGDDLKKPVQLHIVLNSINPFDKILNKYLDFKKESRKNIAKIFFNSTVEKISKINKDFVKELDFNEAQELHHTLKYGLTYPWYFVKKYVESKMAKSVITRENTKIKQEISDIIQKNIDKFYPNLNLEAHSINMDDVINIMNKQKYGYITFAHPALTPIGSFLKNPQKSEEAMSKLFKLIKEKSKDKFIAAEIYYPYFGECGESTNWLNIMKKSAQENNLILTGGLDSHGKNIFYSNK